MKDNPGRIDDEEMSLLGEKLFELKTELAAEGFEFVGSYYFAYDKEFEAAQRKVAELGPDPRMGEIRWVEIIPDSQHHALFAKRVG